MPEATAAWWTLLRVVAAFNLFVWVAVASWCLADAHTTALAREARNLRREQLLLSAVYVAGCAYRSWMPVYDVPRLVMVDSWGSSALVGRSVATLAELCFAAQWMLVLRSAARETGSAFGAAAARALLPLIVVAEAFSWHAVLTTCNLGHVVEESLWGAGAALLAASLATLAPRLPPPRRRLLRAIVAAAVVYALYMFTVDVPMYWARWIADEAQGRTYLDPWSGALDAATRRVVSHRWEDWRSEVGWMTLYFSVAVWTSIALVGLPRPVTLRAAPDG
jgi:hypothetical protein